MPEGLRPLAQGGEFKARAFALFSNALDGAYVDAAASKAYSSLPKKS
jgi:hypothetical protein